MVQHPTRPDELYAALEINGVMRSTDGGDTWTDLSAPLIKLAEQPHLLMVANLPGLEEADLKLGMPLQVTFEQVCNECTLPQFVRAEG